MDGAVPIDDEMVSDAAPAARLVPAVDVGHREVAPLFRRGTMEDDVVDFSHSLIWS